MPTPTASPSLARRLFDGPPAQGGTYVRHHTTGQVIFILTGDPTPKSRDWQYTSREKWMEYHRLEKKT